MTDNHQIIVSALNTVLPTHYEMFLHSGLETPCISYMELTNFDYKTGDTCGYSMVSYQIKVWATDIALIQKYALEVDKVVRPLGFKRTSSAELFDENSSMIQKVMTYEGMALENFKIGD